MKLVLISALLLSSCSQPGTNRASVPAKDPAAVTPERGVESMLSQETDRIAAIAGLSQLSSSNLGNDDVEVNAGLLTLPDGTDLPDPDAQGYEVQVKNGASYRSYHYVAPENSELPAAKNMLEIGDIISSEFGLQRFKARKPGAS